jgi:hypothetical protein
MVVLTKLSNLLIHTDLGLLSISIQQEINIIRPKLFYDLFTITYVSYFEVVLQYLF